MSVVFNSKFGEIRDGWDRMDNEETSQHRGRCQISVWFIGGIVFLGLLYLLLLAVIIGLMTRNTKNDSPMSIDLLRPVGLTQCDNLTQWIELQMSYNTLSQSRNQLQTMYGSLTEERDALRQERDQLKLDSTNLTKEMELLQSKISTLTVTRDQLQEEVKRLNLNRTEKLCPDRWKRFDNHCYFVSPSGMTNSWDKSKKDCEDRGAHLVIITTKDEQDFVSRFYDRIWIGLSDKVTEGSYKWVDGTDLVGPGFWQRGEPNDGDSLENCVEVSHGGGGWNDMSCHHGLSWVCEISV